MKDGLRLFDLAKKIKTVKNATVSLATTAPVCGKTKKYLEENEIKITSDYIVK